MKENIIKYFSKKACAFVAIFNLIIMVIFITLAAIFIKTMNDKLTNILLILLVNLIIMVIIFAFSIGSTSYETVYQIKTDKQVYHPKLYRYLIILFAFAWLIFFILNAFYMIVIAGINNSALDYFTTLQNYWWVLLIVTGYHVGLIILHRQLVYYAINHQALPWEKFAKKNKN